MKENDINYINKIKNTSSIVTKKIILTKLGKNEWVRNFIYYALNPMITYNLSEKRLRAQDYSEEGVMCFKDIFDCCRYLSKLKSMDDSTFNQVRAFLCCFEREERELYIELLSKTIRLGITAKTVNSVWKDFLPCWDIQQAYSINRFEIKKNTEFWLTQKLNGVRATYWAGRLIGRSGNYFLNMEHILSSPIVSYARDNNLVLDGELTLVNPKNMSENEAFRAATGIINSDEVNKTSICYTIFDVIPKDEFDNVPSTIYSKRRELMESISQLNNEFVKVLPVLYHGNDTKVIAPLLDKMVAEDKEGLMVNFDVPYQRKRHSGILKIKRFYTVDLRVVGFEEGFGRLKGTLGALIVDYCGNQLKVGSGIDDELRSKIWNNKDLYLNQICEVKYKERSYDKKTGIKSLQFPVFVSLRTDKDETSLD